MKKFKVNERSIFIYFVLVAPILTKIIEWAFQWITYGGWSHLAHGVWLMQLLFIEFLALIIYASMDYKGKFNGMNVIYLPGVAYLLKEVYNLVFVYKVFNAGTFIAIFFEPIMMMFLAGYVPYWLFFSKKGGRK